MRGTSRIPGPTALADAATGRMSMPFLPTLATVIVLAAASAFCPSPEPAGAAKPASKPVVESVAAAPAAILAPTAPGFAAPAHAAAAQAGPRLPVPSLPAPLAFAALYPVEPAPEPALVASAAARAPVSAPGHRPTPRLAAARRPCPGRRCPETPLVPGSRAEPPARAGTEEDNGLPPLALPFAGSVAEAVAPAVRAVGRAADAMTGRAVGGAADFLRGGAASVKGSVTLLAECLP
ncbi:hypothetical protein Q8W71_16980 [Methylobacterium sp. NEAU 140]|uniref:hypothetical protein n=1 Tax=Methylobacterium sp. NEAU 140 TaxID=3064945 RepID=UPI002733F753|nr:hypothetical protein [Methylobacterium sp. NEAU 140]MDP4024323.1 hypothetical protein [Methylobacterium sp. NEAU 140]